MSRPAQASGDGSDESAGENDMVAELSWGLTSEKVVGCWVMVAGWWLIMVNISLIPIISPYIIIYHLVDGGDWNIGEMYGIMMVNDG